MKSSKDFKSYRAEYDSDSMRKVTKLSPMRKSGKDRRSIFEEIDEPNEDTYTAAKKRESVLDYYDD